MNKTIALTLLGLSLMVTPAALICEDEPKDEHNAQHEVSSKEDVQSYWNKIQDFKHKVETQWDEVKGNELTAAAIDTTKKMYEKSPEAVYFIAGAVFAKVKKLRLVALTCGATYLYMKNKAKN